MRTFPLAVSMTLFAGALFIAFMPTGRTVESGYERMARTRVIRIGYAWEQPYAYRDASGRVTGESPEVARAVLKRIGIDNTEWVQTDFGNLITELRAGRYDIIAAGMFITEERDRLIDFSSPSACIEPGLLVRKGNPLGLHSLPEIAAHGGARLAVLDSAVEESDARAAGIPQDRVLLFADVNLAVTALYDGMVDAIALSGPTVQRIAQEEADFERATPFRGRQPISGCAAFAFRHEDGELRTRFDRALRAFVGTGEHLKLVGEFGFTRGNLPPNAQGGQP